jgi:hypothetical protein
MRLSGVTSEESRGPGLLLLREGANQDANIVRATRTVSTREQFKNSLGKAGTEAADQPNSIRSLPLDRRAEPLAALALRISLLPGPDRFAMNREFLKAFNEIPEKNRTLNLTALANVAAYSVDASANPQFVHPRTAAWRGANPGPIALFYNINDRQIISELERTSAESRELGSAGQRVWSGENVQTVAKESGFTTELGISRLESSAINSRQPESAGRLVTSGQHVQTVATLLGIVTQSGIRDLEIEAARSREPGSPGLKVSSGENVKAVAEASGIVSPYGIYYLELMAASSDHLSGARQALKAGATIAEVAQRFGFTTPEALDTLKRSHRIVPFRRTGSGS